MKYRALEIDNLVIAAQKPSRYVGGEVNSVRKDLPAMRATWALCFPDVYEVGMSNLGFRVLYEVLNSVPDIACERAFMPWPDMAQLQRQRGIPLWSWESRAPLRDFDILGFSLQFEACYATCLEMLDLAGVPIYSRDRQEHHPLVLAGGPCTLNGEPVAPFFDAMVLGDGEEVVLEISQLVAQWKEASGSRQELLASLSQIPGVYVPSFFEVRYKNDKTIAEIIPLRSGYERIKRRVVSDLNTVPGGEQPVVPFMQTVHDRFPVEIQRGCARGCRFCQVGMISRPVRQRHPQQVLETVRKGLANTGWEEAGFLSLSAGDYGCINPLLETFFEQFAPEKVAISLPSLRTETMNEQLAKQIGKVRKTGFTIAPEAASERLRKVINKGNSEENLKKAIQSVFSSGWSMVKLYFMIGLPTESDQDILAIAQLARRALGWSKSIRPDARINLAVSTFVPKPFTPFQWEPMIGVAETMRKHDLLRSALPRPGALIYRYHEAKGSLVEAALARGDRRVATAVHHAWRLGQKLDGWTEHFSFERWEKAFAEMEKQHQVSFSFQAHRERSENEILPWNHLDAGVSREFLLKERERSRSLIALDNCVSGPCQGCGVCDEKIGNRIYEIKDFSISDQTPVWEKSISKAKEETRFFIRLQYGKKERAIALSHLETMNALLRALRRSGLPLAYSRGFNPRPRISFGPACPVGVESQAEYCDIELTQTLNMSEVESVLCPQLPALLPFIRVDSITANEPSLSTAIRWIRYCFHFDAGCGENELIEIIKKFCLDESLVITRGNNLLAKSGRNAKPVRQIDLKLVIKELQYQSPKKVSFLLKAGNEATAKPLEIAGALFGGLNVLRICKEKAVFV